MDTTQNTSPHRANKAKIQEQIEENKKGEKETQNDEEPMKQHSEGETEEASSSTHRLRPRQRGFLHGRH